jgi:hypothetical protein
MLPVAGWLPTEALTQMLGKRSCNHRHGAFAQMCERQLSLGKAAVLDIARDQLPTIADRTECDLKRDRLIVKQAAPEKLEAVALDDR